MKEEKEVSSKWVKYKGKKIFLTKDLMQTVSGVMLVLLSLILSGFFAFVRVGFDPSKLITWDFWVSYFINIGTMYLCFFGVYVIRESRNKKQPKIVTNNQARRDFRDMIINNRKLDSCENWLKIYNYEKRVSIHRDNLLEELRKIDLRSPDANLDRNSRKYKKQEVRHKANKDRADYLKKQLEFTNKHFAIIEKLKLNKADEAKALKNELTDDDSFRCARIRWRDVYFNDLFNGSMQHDSNTIFYNKGKAIFDNIKTMLILSICSTIITTSMILNGSALSIYTIISIISNIAMMCGYAITAMRVADNVVFDVIYQADENKLHICNLFKEDDERVNAEWQDFEDDDPEEDEDNEKENNT